MKIGIISDTHNLLRAEVIQNLQGCDTILHGGDISSQEILDQLQQIAPVKVVRGNKALEKSRTFFLCFLPGGVQITKTVC